MTTDVDLARQLSALTDFITPFAIQAACELAIPDALADRPLAVEELAKRLDCHPPALRRLVTALTSKGILTQPEPDVVALTELGQLLREDHPMSLRAANLPWLPRIEALNNLAHSVRTGESAFHHVHGATVWEYLAAHPVDSALFDRQMRAISGFEAAALLDCYDWAGARTVADIGGGNGALLHALLAAHPEITGTLFDLPQVLDRARGGDRLRLVAGNFFTDPLPGGQDIYVLKRIVYGFNDDEVRTLLAALRAAAPAGARVLVVEPFTSAELDENYFTHRIDLQMLACPGGRVRSAAELGAFLADAGFQIRAVIASATPVLEAVAR